MKKASQHEPTPFVFRASTNSSQGCWKFANHINLSMLLSCLGWCVPLDSGGTAQKNWKCQKLQNKQQKRQTGTDSHQQPNAFCMFVSCFLTLVIFRCFCAAPSTSTGTHTSQLITLTTSSLLCALFLALFEYVERIGCFFLNIGFAVFQTT